MSVPASSLKEGDEEGVDGTEGVEDEEGAEGGEEQYEAYRNNPSLRIAKSG